MIDWAVAKRALPGENVSGDLHLVQAHERGVLLAVVDGLGHGPEATRAAEAAVEALRRQPGDSLHALTNRCHAALSNTRGAVMTLATLNEIDRTITWGGIGNVEALLFRSDSTSAPTPESVLLRSGTLGGTQLPVFYASVIPVNAGDVLIFASDGIRPEFDQDVPVKSPPQRIADHILSKHFKGSDDALVLVVRFNGTSHE